MRDLTTPAAFRAALVECVEAHPDDELLHALLAAFDAMQGARGSENRRLREALRFQHASDDHHCPTCDDGGICDEADVLLARAVTARLAALVDAEPGKEPTK